MLNRAVNRALVRALTLAIAMAGTAGAWAQGAARQTHIDGDVPAAAQFAPLLQRDLLAYFKANGLAGVDRVDYQLFRSEPTQSGVSHPKYYAWAMPFAGARALPDGAVRVAAVGRTQFDVTHFVPRSQITGNPAAVEAVFPMALVAAIVQRAAAP